MDRVASCPERFPGLLRSAVEALAVAACCTAVALGFNALRPVGLPLVATTPYQTMVPCPEPGGPVEAMAADDPSLALTGVFLIDARSADEFRRGHLDGAVNVPFDWLDPVPAETIADLAGNIAASHATRVVVYGDGGRPDSGEHLGREISGSGIKNVYFVTGGAPAALGEGGS